MAGRVSSASSHSKPYSCHLSQGQRLYAASQQHGQREFASSIHGHDDRGKIAQSPVSTMSFPGYANVRLSFDELAAAAHNDE